MCPLVSGTPREMKSTQTFQFNISSPGGEPLQLSLDPGIYQETPHCNLEGTRNSSPGWGHCPLQERTNLPPQNLRGQSPSSSPEKERRYVQSHHLLWKGSGRTQHPGQQAPQPAVSVQRSGKIWPQEQIRGLVEDGAAGTLAPETGTQLRAAHDEFAD